MRSKRNDIYDSLRDAILQGELLPGEAIAERAVAESFGASRIPLREAVIQLERDGLLTVVARRGAFVRKFSAAEVQHLYELREALEGLAAARAATVLPRGAFDEFCLSFRDALDTEAPTLESAERLGTAFHEKVLEECGNPLVRETAATIRGQVQLAKRTSYHHASPDWVRRSVQEHLAVAVAINEGDGAAAERLMREHIATWSRHFRDSLDLRTVPGLL